MFGCLGKNHFHPKITFIKNPLSSKIHFHPKTTFIPNPLSSQTHFHPKTTFIQKPLSSINHFHQKPISSKTTLIRNIFIKTTLIRNHFHHKSHRRGTGQNTLGCQKQKSPCFCESVAGFRPATLSQKHGLCPLFGFQQAST